MRFKQFITEQEFNFDKFLKDCAPYLEAIKGISYGKLAKHGSKDAPEQWDITEFQPRPGPRDTPKELHKQMNLFFQEKFGWKARSHSLFVTGDYTQAVTYGSVSFIFPIGKFQTLWSPDVYDLYHEYTEIKDNLRRGGMSDEWEALLAKAVVGTTEKLKKDTWHFNDELIRGLEVGHEIMMFAPAYYEVRVYSDTHDILTAALKEKGIIT